MPSSICFDSPQFCRQIKGSLWYHCVFSKGQIRCPIFLLCTLEDRRLVTKKKGSVTLLLFALKKSSNLLSRLNNALELIFEVRGQKLSKLIQSFKTNGILRYSQLSFSSPALSHVQRHAMPFLLCNFPSVVLTFAC